ncbi:MAG TPA: asparaginase domain-containing protein [Candidatus Binataceae bacterium]|nr:asparaginase domain-containing protein [Candidatus Binataceae bacterium]
MSKPRIAVFSGPRSTVANSPLLVTSNQGRLAHERQLEGRFDHLVPQRLYEPVKIKIEKFSAHPLEQDAREVYHDNGLDYWEAELRPEDGPLLLPYVARRANGTPQGTPFEQSDLHDPQGGGRQSFYPDASRLFEEIDRSISGRNSQGEGNTLARIADFDFVRALPPAGYTLRGERSGRDYFPYFPNGTFPPPGAMARVVNVVQGALASGRYAGAIWLEGSSHLEETLYWLSLLVDTELPIVGVAAQRPHGALSADGDRNIVDAASYIVSGQGNGLGAVAAIDEQIFAARDFKKNDDRPGGFKATGGHGGILGTMGPPVTIWYSPRYRHTANSLVNVSRLPSELALPMVDGQREPARLAIKNADGSLRGEAMARVHIVKYAHYSADGDDPEQEVDIMARLNKALAEQDNLDPGTPKLHGMVLEGSAAYGQGSNSQTAALTIASFSGLPVVRVGRADPGGRVSADRHDLFIRGSNLDANKARLLLIAAMLRLGRLPRARDPRHPTAAESSATLAKIAQFQELFESH